MMIDITRYTTRPPAKMAAHVLTLTKGGSTMIVHRTGWVYAQRAGNGYVSAHRTREVAIEAADKLKARLAEEGT